MNDSFFIPRAMGTAAGTLTIFLANINSTDIIKTMILAALGATVSFFVSLSLRKIVKWFRSRH